MHSSSADCVFGEARLISSTSSRFAKTGPGRKRKEPVAWSKKFTPVTSDGRRSGVNWSRENVTSSERASAFASIVFPTPGKSSTIRCPCAIRQRTTSRSTSAGACTTRARFASSAAIVAAGSAGATGSACPKQPFHLVEDLGGDPLLRRALHGTLAGARHERDRVVRRLEADPFASHVVVDDEIHALVREHRALALEPHLAVVGAEADEHLARAAARAELLQHVGR